MNQRISIILVGVFCLIQVACPALATKPRLSVPPHTVSIKLEPESVNVGSTAKIAVTFIPCADVESLRIWLLMPYGHGVRNISPRLQTWSGNLKKGKPVTISGLVELGAPGLYMVEMTYVHNDSPKFHLGHHIRDLKALNIRVPGGLEDVRRESALYRGECEGGPPQEVINVDSLRDRVPHERTMRGVVQTQGMLPGDSMHQKHSLSTERDSGISVLPSASVSTDTIWWGSTEHFIATCDKILYWLQGEDIADMDNWRVVPPSLGTVIELPDHTARFTAGSAAGTGLILSDWEGYVCAIPAMVIANYHLNGTFFYKNKTASLNLPIIDSKVKLYTVDSQARDDSGTCYSQRYYYRLVDSTYTNQNGYYQFQDLNVDSILVLVGTQCPSHDVVYHWNDTWKLYRSGYCWFTPECWMDWQNPVVSYDCPPFGFDTRAAFYIMSLAHKGVDYVAGLPDSHFPEKVIFWWDPDSSGIFTEYKHQGIPIWGQVYDLITVRGYGNNPDEWDEDMFLHEYGHFVMDNYAYLLPPEQLPNCGPEHKWDLPSSVECAYAEGWATFYSAVCQNDPIIIDSFLTGPPDSIDIELPTQDPQGAGTEGAVCASLWDIFDAQNDSTFWGEVEQMWFHNWDFNGGMWWQGINLIWWAIDQPGDLGHLPYTICQFGHIWGWSGYPVDFTWCANFVAHGIICDVCDPVGVADGSASKTDSKPFLWPNRPNPFNPLTQVAFRIASYGKVSIRVCDVGGRVVRTLVDAYKEPGSYTVWWDGKDDSGGSLASGVYLCQLVVGSFKQTRKLVMLR
jgi:hypothetical protein